MTPNVTPESVVEDYLKAPLEEVRCLRWEIQQFCFFTNSALWAELV